MKYEAYLMMKCDEKIIQNNKMKFSSAEVNQNDNMFEIIIDKSLLLVNDSVSMVSIKHVLVFLW